MIFFLVNIGFDLYQIQNNKGTKKQYKSGIENSAIFEEEILVEDDRTPSDMQRIQEILASLNLT